MLNANNFDPCSFSSNTQVIAPLIHCYMSGKANQDVAISKSLHAAKPLFVPIESMDQSCISVEALLSLLDERLLQEKKYKNEVLELKNSIWEEFNRACQAKVDENFIKFVRDERQQIINYLYEAVNLEKKLLATNFLNNVLNGFEAEAFDNFEKMIYGVLWKPFMTPLPFDLVEKLRDEFKEMCDCVNEKNVKKCSIKALDIIQNHFLVNCIDTINFENPPDLEEFFQDVANNRMTIIVNAFEINEKLDIIQNFQSKCVQDCGIIAEAKDYANRDIKCVYDALALISGIENDDIKPIFEKFPRGLKMLNLLFDNAEENAIVEFSTLFSKLIFLIELHLDFSNLDNNIKDNGLCSISEGIKRSDSLTILELNFRGENKQITNKGATTLSESIKNMKSLIFLKLNFTGSSITGDGFNSLAASLCCLNQMSYLGLEFNGGNNSANDESITKISHAIYKMKNLNFLSLNFCEGKHTISEAGMNSLSDALAQTINIATLILFFNGLNNANKMTNSSMIYLSKSLTKMQNLSALSLHFSYGNHEIGDEGMSSLAESLEKIECLSQLVLQFLFGNNSIGDKGVIDLSQALNRKKLLFDFSLNFWGGLNKVTDLGIKNIAELLKNIKELRKLRLNFGGGNHSISDNGICALADSICNLQKVDDLHLYFHEGNNQISDESMKVLAESLKKMKKITKLKLAFFGGKNNISDKGMEALAEGLVFLSSPLEFEFQFIGSPNTVSQTGIELLKSARTYQNFKSHQQ